MRITNQVYFDHVLMDVIAIRYCAFTCVGEFDCMSMCPT